MTFEAAGALRRRALRYVRDEFSTAGDWLGFPERLSALNRGVDDPRQRFGSVAEPIRYFLFQADACARFFLDLGLLTHGADPRDVASVRTIPPWCIAPVARVFRSSFRAWLGRCRTGTRPVAHLGGASDPRTRPCPG